MFKNEFIQDKTWQELLKSEFQKSYMQDLGLFLQDQYQQGKEIYPQTSEIFASLNATSFEKVRVVILGQDPYHGEGEAHGLSFSVQEGIKIPSSLRNIFKELENDLNVKAPKSGNLTRWAQQGVLLLNDVLTVEKDKAHAHKNKGWEQFTDAVISLINERKEHVVFILWGKHAQKKGAKIDRKKHFVIESSHPSGLSAYRGFIGSKPFSEANKYLKQHGESIIDWQL